MSKSTIVAFECESRHSERCANRLFDIHGSLSEQVDQSRDNALEAMRKYIAAGEAIIANRRAFGIVGGSGGEDALRDAFRAAAATVRPLEERRVCRGQTLLGKCTARAELVVSRTPVQLLERQL